jgi:serine/threonine-protein kinase
VSYLILTGRAPFEGRNLPEVLQAVLHDMPAPMAAAEAPEALARVIDRALRKLPDDRYQTCAEVLSALEAVRDYMVHQ